MVMVQSAVVLCLAVLLYAWIFYPALLAAVAARKRRAERGAWNAERGTRNMGGGGLRVSVLVSAYNEEKNIRERVKNLLSTTGHLDDCEILIGIDGSVDGTAREAKDGASGLGKVSVIEYSPRAGKVAVLKRLAQLSKGDFLVFTDANTVFAPGALDRLLNHFGDPVVGGVCGRLVFRKCGGEEKSGSENLQPETAYWRGETWLKEKESEVDSCLGANGAIYAIRRNLFPEDIPDNTIVDDFVIGMKVRQKGFRMVYEPDAVAEEGLPSEADEWQRRVRIGSGDYQALLLCKKCLNPGFGLFSWVFWSHKVLRWFTPHLCLLLVAGCLLVVGEAIARVQDSGFRVQEEWAVVISVVILAACALLLFLGFLGRVLPARQGPISSFLGGCMHFVAMQAALFAGFLRFCRGGLSGMWDRTPRAEDGRQQRGGLNE